jgi:hypothetical protein
VLLAVFTPLPMPLEAALFQLDPGVRWPFGHSLTSTSLACAGSRQAR